MYNKNCTRPWRNWQTRCLQAAVLRSEGSNPFDRTNIYFYIIGGKDMLEHEKKIFQAINNNPNERVSSSHFGQSAKRFALYTMAYTICVIYLLPSILTELKFPSIMVQVILILAILFGCVVYAYMSYMLYLQGKLNRKKIFWQSLILIIGSFILFALFSVLGIDYYFNMNWIQI